MSDDSNHHDWFNRVSDVCQALGISAQTLREWARDGYGPRPYQIGGRRRYDRREVAEWIKAQRVEGKRA
jgi:excisionase family DNA binding protein